MRDLKPAGRFSCSDSRLNQIWETGAYTVQLNMQEYLWDGIKRDRLVWVGDMHPEVSTVRSVFGYDACVPKSLDLIRDETPQDAWMNGIPSYSMWWIIIHHDWYLQNGDLTYLRSQKDYLKALLRRLAGAIAPDGTYRFENAWDFVDWSSSQTQYAAAGIHGVLSMALETGAALCGFLDEQEMAGTCLMARERLRHNRLPYAGNKQMAALVSLAGLADPETVEKEVLSQNPCAGSPPSSAIMFCTPGQRRAICPARWRSSGNIGAVCWTWGRPPSGRSLIWNGQKTPRPLISWSLRAKTTYTGILAGAVSPGSAAVCAMAGQAGPHRF